MIWTSMAQEYDEGIRKISDYIAELKAGLSSGRGSQQQELHQRIFLLQTEKAEMSHALAAIKKYAHMEQEDWLS